MGGMGARYSEYQYSQVQLRKVAAVLETETGSRRDSLMETEWVALDLRTQNSKSADARDGIFVVVCSPTTFGNKR